MQGSALSMRSIKQMPIRQPTWRESMIDAQRGCNRCHRARQEEATEAELDDYRRNLESLVEERSRALQREMNEHKQAGDLAESLSHHRVKNNFISSLRGPWINESQQGIKSMALIHEGLYRSDMDIVRPMATDLCQVLISREDIDIQLVVEVQDVRLGLDSAVPCGLIINELVTNCLKHGFVGQQ